MTSKKESSTSKAPSLKTKGRLNRLFASDKKHKSRNYQDVKSAYSSLPLIPSSSYIFISHVEEDHKIAIEIASALEQANYQTWYFERDSIPGMSYILQTSQQIVQAQAFVVIISPDSLRSNQINMEVIRANESAKRVIPLLWNVTIEEARCKKPEWSQMIDPNNAFTISDKESNKIIPKIIDTLSFIGAKEEQRFIKTETSEKVSLAKLTELFENYRIDLTGIVEYYRKEIGIEKALKDAGVIRPYSSRESALEDFATAIDAETIEIVIVGKSLKGLLQLQELGGISQKLRFKVSCGVSVKFLIMHPVIADLRAGQENRNFTEIGQEIIHSLKILKGWGVPPENVRLYKGVPTCFAIKTHYKMLLNPYPNGATAFNSPCLLIETSPDHSSYLYESFDKSHFSAWESHLSERIYNYDETIERLTINLSKYAHTISSILQQ